MREEVTSVRSYDNKVYACGFLIIWMNTPGEPNEAKEWAGSMVALNTVSLKQAFGEGRSHTFTVRFFVGWVLKVPKSHIIYLFYFSNFPQLY